MKKSQVNSAFFPFPTSYSKKASVYKSDTACSIQLFKLGEGLFGYPDTQFIARHNRFFQICKIAAYRGLTLISAAKVCKLRGNGRLSGGHLYAPSARGPRRGDLGRKDHHRFARQQLAGYHAADRGGSIRIFRGLPHLRQLFFIR